MASGRRKRSRDGGSLADINITPLVDVLLVLLIIFMVTAPMMHHGASLPTPDVTPSDDKNPSKEVEKDTLVIDAKGKISLRGKPVDAKALLALLKKDPKLQKSRELYIRADMDLDYGKVMEIIGTMRKAGIRKLGVVVDSTELALPPLPVDPDAPKKRR